MTAMATRTQAALYVHTSRDSEGLGFGVARQEADARKVAKRKGWAVARVYVDNDMSKTTACSSRRASSTRYSNARGRGFGPRTSSRLLLGMSTRAQHLDDFPLLLRVLLGLLPVVVDHADRGPDAEYERHKHTRGGVVPSGDDSDANHSVGEDLDDDRGPLSAPDPLPRARL